MSEALVGVDLKNDYWKMYTWPSKEEVEERSGVTNSDPKARVRRMEAPWECTAML